jgi:hypothetical protein
MWVFIRGIPEAITVRELHKLITRQFSPAWSSIPIRGVRVVESKVLKIMSKESGAWEYYGLVYISPTRLVHAVIGRLNAATINGRRIHAHPYFNRHRHRDRRQQILEGSEPYPVERRRKDRRRVSVVSQIADLKV